VGRPGDTALIGVPDHPYLHCLEHTRVYHTVCSSTAGLLNDIVIDRNAVHVATSGKVPLPTVSLYSL
jgi:hypothetical protein